MKSILRSVLAIVVGVVMTVVVISALEAAGHLLFPLPAGIDPNNPEALRAAMADIPVGAFLALLAAWGMETFVGSCLAAWVAGRAFVLHGLIIGALALAAAIGDMPVIPHPLWFWVAGVAIFLPAAYLGALLAKKVREPTPRAPVVA